METILQERPFRLRRHFSIAGGIAVLLVTVLIATTYYRTEVAEQIEQAEGRNVMLAQTFANSVWPRYKEHLSRLGANGETLRAASETASLHAMVGDMARRVPVLKIKIYNLEGMAVYSSVPSEIGEEKSANPGFRAARAGTAMSELTHRGQMSATEGTIENVDVVSTYIPIFGASNSVDAVFELYSDVTETVNRIERMTLQLVGGLVLVFAVLYAVLLTIVVRADRILQQQYQALEDARLSRMKRFFSLQMAEDGAPETNRR
jgi:hypothetical protein